MPLPGIRKVIEGYSGVFGWIWRYSAHFEHLTVWQLKGMLQCRIRPSTTWYNIKRVYPELWGLSGARGVSPGPAGGFFRKTSFRVLPRSPRQGLHYQSGANRQFHKSNPPAKMLEALPNQLRPLVTSENESQWPLWCGRSCLGSTGRERVQECRCRGAWNLGHCYAPRLRS